MKINLEITYNDGTKKAVSALAIDIVAFEAEFDMSMANLEKNVKLTHLFWLAWHVENRQGNAKDFNTWLKDVEIVTSGEPKK